MLKSTSWARKAGEQYALDVVAGKHICTWCGMHIYIVGMAFAVRGTRTAAAGGSRFKVFAQNLVSHVRYQELVAHLSSKHWGVRALWT